MSGNASRNGIRHPHDSICASVVSPLTVPATAAASAKPPVEPRGVNAPYLAFKWAGADSEMKVAEPPTSPPALKPWATRTRTSRKVAHTPSWAYVGRRPIAVLARPMQTRVATSAFFRPYRSPMWPNTMPPSGRMRYAVPKTASAESREMIGSSLGKNSGATITAM